MNINYKLLLIGVYLMGIFKMKELKCLDPVMKYCQACPYGNIHYSDDVETYYDIFGANFKTYCIYGLE